MKEKNWKLKGILPADGNEESLENFTSEVRKLRNSIQLPDNIIKLLFMRGVTNYAKVFKYFKPTREKLYDPFTMKDAYLGAKRVVKAIEDKENIMVLGDYDVDGTCGVSMFYLFLKDSGLDPSIYIPDRIIEGYGISVKAIDSAAENNVKLIIAIDCGITAADKVKYAKSLGIDFIICDHHQAPEIIPDAVAVLDPQRADDEYPFKFLCGTGVAFKLIQAVCKLQGRNDYPYSLFDFVAIATASDIVPLIDENRILVNEGLKQINSYTRPSIKKLIEISGVSPGSVNTGNIVYSIAPRINAVGRLGDAKRAVELLTSDSPEELKELAYILNSENESRKEIDRTITEDAIKVSEVFNENNEVYSLVVHNEDWHPGVIGIVAARLVERFHLPSIVLTSVNGVAKGSARSINGFNMYEALKQCEDLLIQYGGHYHAAGLELEIEQIDRFREQFNQIAANQLTKEQLTPEILIDMEITFDDISEQFANILRFFEPYGPANMTPIFMTKNVQVVGDVKQARNNTLLFRAREYDPEGKTEGNVFECVFFSSAAFKDDLKTGTVCDICYSVDQNTWNGITKTKLRIRDVKFHN